MKIYKQPVAYSYNIEFTEEEIAKLRSDISRYNIATPEESIIKKLYNIILKE